MKHIIDEAVKKHGKDKVYEALVLVGLAKPSAAERGPCKEETCPTGYYWNNTVCACVFDVGK